MSSTDINNNIYSIKPADSVHFGGFTATRPGFSATKIPEINDTFTKKNNTAKDGRFSFLEFGKNVVKGTGQFFTDIYKNIVKDPYISIPLLVLGAAIASTPVGLAVLAGGGVIASAFSLVFMGIKSGSLIVDKKWDELEKQGTDLGKLIPGTIMRAVGSIKGIKDIQKLAGLTEKASIGKSIAKAADLNNFVVTVMKNIVTSPVKAFNKFVRGKEVDGVLIKAIKNDWTKFVNGENKGNFFKKLINPNLSDKLFNADERTILLNAVEKGKFLSQEGFIDLKFGLGKNGSTRNFLQSIAQGLSGRKGE